MDKNIDMDMWGLTEQFKTYGWNTKQVKYLENTALSGNWIEKSEIFMDYKIRELKQNEISVLNAFLYEAIFIPDGVDAPPYEIINQPELQVYVTDFGKKKGDICYVSECDNKIVGAVWIRILRLPFYPEMRNKTG